MNATKRPVFPGRFVAFMPACPETCGLSPLCDRQAPRGCVILNLRQFPSEWPERLAQRCVAHKSALSYKMASVA
jgi:hypothetical protein